jgi:hypothetical protein
VPKHLVTLYWHGSVPSALRIRLASMDATAPVQVVAAPYTWQQLEAQTHQVSADRASLSAEGYTIASVGPTAAAESGYKHWVGFAFSFSIIASVAFGITLRQLRSVGLGTAMLALGFFIDATLRHSEPLPNVIIDMVTYAPNTWCSRMRSRAGSCPTPWRPTRPGCAH